VVWSEAAASWWVGEDKTPAGTAVLSTAVSLLALSTPAVPWMGQAAVSSPQMVLGFLGTELGVASASDLLCPRRLHLLLPAGGFRKLHCDQAMTGCLVFPTLSCENI
jgi:hypothetical protein